MGIGKKILLYVGIPLAVILILYLVFFVFPKKKTNISRISQINQALRSSNLSNEQIQSLLTEKYVLQQ